VFVLTEASAPAFATSEVSELIELILAIIRL